MSELTFRPSMDWKPHANTNDEYAKEAYRRAGEKLGIRVKFAQPVPCPAGTALTVGLTGVWIHRKDAEKISSNQREFIDQYYKELMEITR